MTGRWKEVDVGVFWIGKGQLTLVTSGPADAFYDLGRCCMARRGQTGSGVRHRLKQQGFNLFI